MKQIVFAMFFLSFLTSVSLASAPRDTELVFDSEHSVLTVRTKHVSKKLREHFIRSISVSINDQAPQTHRYTRQDNPADLEFSIAVDAKPGDVIVVKVSCTEGASASATLKVPSPVVEDEQATLPQESISNQPEVSNR